MVAHMYVCKCARVIVCGTSFGGTYTKIVSLCVF